MADEDLRKKLNGISIETKVLLIALRALIAKLDTDFPDKKIAESFRNLYAETFHHFFPEATEETAEILEKRMRFLAEGPIF